MSSRVCVLTYAFVYGRMYVYLFPCEVLNQWLDFHETRYEHHTNAG
jgi:hypothetical protein